MKTPITREESPEIPKFIKKFFQINHISQVYKKIFGLKSLILRFGLKSRRLDVRHPEKSSLIHELRKNYQAVADLGGIDDLTITKESPKRYPQKFLKSTFGKARILSDTRELGKSYLT